MEPIFCSSEMAVGCLVMSLPSNETCFRERCLSLWCRTVSRADYTK
jgi:hypothetical protein